MTRLQVDKGAIKFILGGANIMCPGFTSPGGRLPEREIETEFPVVTHSPSLLEILEIMRVGDICRGQGARHRGGRDEDVDDADSRGQQGHCSRDRSLLRRWALAQPQDIRRLSDFAGYTLQVMDFFVFTRNRIPQIIELTSM